MMRCKVNILRKDLIFDDDKIVLDEFSIDAIIRVDVHFDDGLPELQQDVKFHYNPSLKRLQIFGINSSTRNIGVKQISLEFYSVSHQREIQLKSIGL